MFHSILWKKSRWDLLKWISKPNSGLRLAVFQDTCGPGQRGRANLCWVLSLVCRRIFFLQVLRVPYANPGAWLLFFILLLTFWLIDENVAQFEYCLILETYKTWFLGKAFWLRKTKISGKLSMLSLLPVWSRIIIFLVLHLWKDGDISTNTVHKPVWDPRVWSDGFPAHPVSTGTLACSVPQRRESSGLGVRPRLHTWWPHFLTLWPWACLSLSFHICEMGIIANPQISVVRVTYCNQRHSLPSYIPFHFYEVFKCGSGI